MSKALTLHHGDCRDLLLELRGQARLVVTSPPYNIGVKYGAYQDRMPFEDYLHDQEEVIALAADALVPGGSLCWQVGTNTIALDDELLPLDYAFYPMIHRYGLKLRRRIIWAYEHGTHASKTFSGRHETILWFTKGSEYVFNLDAVRIPQKYPGKKHFKGPKKGQLSGNPLGKNPGDVWSIPNVKHNHPEKTDHPCQFPLELVERLVLSLSDEGELVVDPYMGSGTSAEAAIRNGRRFAGADLEDRFIEETHQRVARGTEDRSDWLNQSRLTGA